MPRTLLKPLLTAALLAGLAAFSTLPAPAQSAKPAGKSPSTGTSAGESGERRSMTDRIWWNQQRFVEGLKLTAEQREDLDALFTENLSARRAAMVGYQETRRAFLAAAQAGKTAEARKLAGEMSEKTARLTGLEAELILAAMAELSPEQRAEIEKSFPRLLSRPWVRGGMGSGRQMGGEGGPRMRGPRMRGPQTKGPQAKGPQAKGQGGPRR